jgi:tight adherence protein C
MPLYIVLACAAVVAAVPLLVWSVQGLRPVTVPADRRDLGGPLAPQAGRSGQGRNRSFTKQLGSRARRLTPAGFVDQLERRIVLAGASGRWSIEQVLATKLVLGGVGVLCGLTRLSSGLSAGAVASALALPALGYLLPDTVLAGRARERQKVIRRELPDVLDQITVSVEAGLGFDAALAQAGRTGKGPLAEELSRTMQDILIGTSRLAALSNLAQRTDVSDLRHFVAAVKQADQYGVPIAQVLRVQSKELREKRRQRAEEHAMKIPVKIVFPLILCILPAMFVVVLGPTGLRIADALFRP